MNEPLFLRDPFIIGYSIRDNNPEGVRVTGVRGLTPTEGRKPRYNRKKEGVGGVGTVSGVWKKTNYIFGNTSISSKSYS